MRGLLAILVTLGSLLAVWRPARAQSTLPEFVDITQSAGLQWGVRTLSPGIRNLVDTMGGGGGFLDFDGDGWLDIYLVCPTQAPQTDNAPLSDALYRNNGNGTFTNVTEKAGLNHKMTGMGLAVGDYNNDGAPDLYLTGFGASRLYRNNGNGTFADVSNKVPTDDKLWGTSAAWFDYDNDGWLDLYVAHYVKFDPLSKVPCQLYEGRPYCNIKQFAGAPPTLWHNNRDGTFTDVSAKAGVALPNGKGLGVVAFDYNHDGRMDIFQANDAAPNFLFRNNGDGTFSEVALEANCAFDPNGEVRGGMGVDAADVDGDGWPELFVTNFSQQTNAFWHNNADGTFDETTYKMGLGAVSLPMSGFGTKFLDYNNDGRLDLFVHNGHPFEPINKVFPETTYAEPPFLFENAGPNFRDVAAQRGAPLKRPYAGRGLATGDLDNDGDPDLLLLNIGAPPVLLRNDGGNRNAWLGLRLIGSRSNRDANGAVVTLTTGAGRRIQQVMGGTSYCSASDARLLFGLGEQTKVEEITIAWPRGGVTTLKNIAANRYLVIREENAK